jgi:alkaline phosphatase D
MIEQIKVIGVWDDNDYGKNNGGSTFTAKDQNRKLYLDFVDEPNDSQRRL